MLVKISNLVCDRCKRKIRVIDEPDLTGGFYRVQSGSPWNRYANPGESVVCDVCVWKDERYIKDFGEVYEG